MASNNHNYGGYTAPAGYNDRNDVRALQDGLRAAGYDPGRTDGLYGPRTDAAYRAYSASQQAAQQDAQQTARTPSVYAPSYAVGGGGMSRLNDAIQSGLDTAQTYYREAGERARRDAREQGKAAYADYARFVNPYGAQREAQAGMGLTGAGLAESTMLGAYNAYQNRAAGVQRDLDKILTDYEIAMMEARAQGDMQRAQAAQQMAMAQMQQAQFEAEMRFEREQAAAEAQRWQQRWDYETQPAQVSQPAQVLRPAGSVRPSGSRAVTDEERARAMGIGPGRVVR